MSRFYSLVPRTMVFTSAVMIVGLAGCSQPARQSLPSAEGAQTHSHDDYGHADDREIEAALARLSPADQVLAEKQELCPVSGEPLGSMGGPIRLTVQGRELFVCCAGCEEAVRKDPEKYFSKLDEHAH